MRKLYFLSAFLLGFGVQAQMTFSVESSPYCPQQGCSQLFADDIPVLYQTNGYAVSAMPYFEVATYPTNPIIIGGIGGVIPPTGDDVWSPIINLPFNFSFYGTNYNSILVGTNGVITFDIVNQSPLEYCNWSFNQAIPNANFAIKNAIFGVYQDNNIAMPPVVNPAEQNVNYYVLDTGINAAPNRVFVANFNELPQFQCNNSVGLQTSQIILREGSNIIDVIVKKRTPCTSWNSGSGVIGIMDATGTQAVVPPGRNTGTWSATDEAWRFTPSGSAIPATITWSENGSPIGTDNPITVCPQNETAYSATLTYENTNIQITKDILVSPIPYNLAEPIGIQVCGDAPYVVNLTENTPLVLANVNPNHYAVSYYEDPEQAELGATTNIGNPLQYSFTTNRTIYMRVENIEDTGCHYILPFEVSGNPLPSAPTGSATQTFTVGQTLANLVVSGQNIQWYDHPTAGNLLPATTQLVHNTTYYASQSIGGCESRMLPQRLAVTVSSTLGNTAFVAANIALYPNPAKNTLTVAFAENISKTEIFNTLGQLVLRNYANGKEIKLDVSTLAAGQYFVKVYAGDQQAVSKFIKK